MYFSDEDHAYGSTDDGDVSSTEPQTPSSRESKIATKAIRKPCNNPRKRYSIQNQLDIKNRLAQLEPDDWDVGNEADDENDEHQDSIVVLLQNNPIFAHCCMMTFLVFMGALSCWVVWLLDRAGVLNCTEATVDFHDSPDNRQLRPAFRPFWNVILERLSWVAVVFVGLFAMLVVLVHAGDRRLVKNAGGRKNSPRYNTAAANLFPMTRPSS